MASFLSRIRSLRRPFTPHPVLHLLWILLFLWVEQVSYIHAIAKCSWPLDTPQQRRPAIIADPQIIDENTYPRRGLAMSFTKLFTDRYMRRNYRWLNALR